MPEIVLVPIGSIAEEVLSALETALPDLTGRSVEVGESLRKPGSAYDSRRLQYEGDLLLDLLARHPASSRSVLGIIDADCFTPGLNFVFGQALFCGREGFIALSRLRQSFYGLEDDRELFHERITKEAVHELGHTWGLAHCPDAGCVMHFSNGLRDTDIKGPRFCGRCTMRVEPVMEGARA